jgi:hypothetical protein
MRYIIIISLITLSLNANNDEKIREFFLDNGFTYHGVAAIMGFLYYQSSFDPSIYDKAKQRKIGLTNEEYIRKTNDGSYKNFVTDKVGFGIAFWVHYSKKRELLNMCRGKISDLYCQLNFFMKELIEYPDVYEILKNTYDLSTACDTIFIDFGQYEINKLLNQHRIYCKKFL